MFCQKRAICSAFVPRFKKDNASDNDLFFAAFRKIIKISSPPVTINSSPVLIGKSHFPLSLHWNETTWRVRFCRHSNLLLTHPRSGALAFLFPSLPPSRLADYGQTSKPPEKINENRTKILWVLEIESSPIGPSWFSRYPPPPSSPPHTRKIYVRNLFREVLRKGRNY